jgi:hypothetical protein
MIEHETNTIRMPIDGIFIAIGHSPNTEFLKNIVDLDEHGLIVCQGNTQKTSHAGIYAAGDVENNYKQAGVAAGNAIKAALDAYKFLQEVGITQNFIDTHQSLWKYNTTINTTDSHKNNTENSEQEIVCNDTFCTITYKTKPNTSNFQEIKTISSIKELHNIQEKHTGYYLIDLYTKACPGCVILKKTLEKYNENNESYPIYILDIGSIHGALDIFNVQNVPTLILMKSGIEIARRTGSCSLAELNDWLKKSS